MAYSKTMKSKLGFVCALIVAGGLFHEQDICAMPRSAWPPVPEPRAVDQESFDEEYSSDSTNSEWLIPNTGVLVESWSGYALQRVGNVIPFVVPAVDSTGHTNITCDAAGTLRFWVKPYWSNGSETNGLGGTLLELDAVNGAQSALVWSLQVSNDGNTVNLFAETSAGLQEVLQAPISWQAGTWHCVALNFGPQTALFLDGALAAQGSGLPSIPPSAGQLVIGSTLGATNVAGSDFDEFYSFASPLMDSDIAMYYGLTSAEAALGPISDDEVANRFQAQQQSSLAGSINGFDPMNDPSGCVTNGPVFITNIVASVDASSNITVSLDIQGGTNGFFDLYTTTNLAGVSNLSQLTWLCRVLTCNTYLFSNQPPNAAFYAVAPPTPTMVVAWGDDTFGECDVPVGLTNATGIAAGWDFSLALLNDGTVIG